MVALDLPDTDIDLETLFEELEVYITPGTRDRVTVLPKQRAEVYDTFAQAKFRINELIYVDAARVETNSGSKWLNMKPLTIRKGTATFRVPLRMLP